MIDGDGGSAGTVEVLPLQALAHGVFPVWGPRLIEPTLGSFLVAFLSG